jgi:hypothetical protein
MSYRSLPSNRPTVSPSPRLAASVPTVQTAGRSRSCTRTEYIHWCSLGIRSIPPEAQNVCLGRSSPGSAPRVRNLQWGTGTRWDSTFHRCTQRPRRSPRSRRRHCCCRPFRSRCRSRSDRMPPFRNTRLHSTGRRRRRHRNRSARCARKPVELIAVHDALLEPPSVLPDAV